MKFIIKFLCLALIVLTWLSSMGSAQPVKRVIVVLVPGVTLEEMVGGIPVVREIIPMGAIGLMNSRTASPAVRESSWREFTFEIPADRPSLEGAIVTLGAGARSIADASAGEAANFNEITLHGPAAKIYQQRMGEAPQKAGVLCISIPQILWDNKELGYELVPGLLGSVLHKNHRQSAVLGNSDTVLENHREAVTLAMDSKGLVDLGDVSRDLLIKDPSCPGGVRTDIQKLIAKYKKLPEQTSLVVIETGESARLDRAAPLMNDLQYQVQLRKSLERTNELLIQLITKLDPKNQMLMVLSPIPSRFGWHAGNRLAPVFMFGAGVQPGLLSSPSTRKPGLVTNTDITPTILKSLGLEVPKTAIGRAIHVEPSDASLKALFTYNRKQALLASKQGPVPRAYTWVQVVILLLSLGLILRFPQKFKHWATRLLIFIPAALPMALLATGMSPEMSSTATYVFVAGVSISLALLAMFLADTPYGGITLLAGVYTLAVLLDIYNNSQWIMNSVYGYSDSEGARYYGIGNEYMGYLVGSSAILAGFIMQTLRSKKWLGLPLSAILLGTATFAIGFPALGANSGGGIAAAACSAAAVILLSGARLTKRNLVLVAAAVFVFVGGLVALDLSRGVDSQSHIGHAAQAIASGGVGEAFEIITRKLSMNMKLLKFSPSSRLMILGAAISIWLMIRRKERLQKRWAIYGAIQAVLVGAAAGFIFNDSGVLAAANTLVFAVTPLLAIEMESLIKETQPHTKHIKS